MANAFLLSSPNSQRPATNDIDIVDGMLRTCAEIYIYM